MNVDHGGKFRVQRSALPAGYSEFGGVSVVPTSPRY